ncbi:MAG: hypothetical protein K2X39_06975, partial [Silvanigrellaceae bacterium]|nr:hypothetical protein [Silvanigrellaceae bacterium]
MKQMLKFFIAFCLVLSFPIQAEKTNLNDKEQLSYLLFKFIEAMNSDNLEKLDSLFYKDFVVTTSEQAVFRDVPSVKKYLKELEKSDRFYGIKAISFQPKADQNFTTLLNNNIAYATGTSTDTFSFKDGDVRVMTSAWTASLI